MNRRQSAIWLWCSADILVALLSTVISLVITNPGNQGINVGELLSVRITLKNLLLLGVFLTIWTGIHHAYGLYAYPKQSKQLSHLRETVFAASFGSIFFLFFPLTSKSLGSIFRPELAFLGASVVLSVLVRIVAWHSVPRFAKATATPVKTLIVGSGPIARDVYRSLLNSDSPIELLGFVDSPGTHTVAEAKLRLLGNFEQLEAILVGNAVDEVAVALPLRSCYDKIQRVIATCERIGTPAAYTCQPFVHERGYSRVDDSQTACIRWRPSRDVESHPMKRIVDVMVSTAALIVLAPLFLGIAVAIKTTSPGSAIFMQERYGLNKRKFRMYKFRTMVPDAESRQTALESQNEAQGPVFKMKRDPRVIPIGRFLRKTSFDELPQLLNVLKGDMSLVGPRPLPNRDVARFNDPWLMRRFSVKPGLTCLWQINGRSNTNFDEWISLDLKYIDTWSPMLDLKILALTIPAVLLGRGAA